MLIKLFTIIGFTVEEGKVINGNVSIKIISNCSYYQNLKIGK